MIDTQEVTENWPHKEYVDVQKYIYLKQFQNDSFLTVEILK